MAFYNRIGSIMRQTISQNSVSNGQVTGPSIFSAIRCMSIQLFIGGLSPETDERSLKEAFSDFGDLTEARVIKERDTGKSRGYGFVGYSSSESANEAIKAMNGEVLDNRLIRVSFAKEPTPRPHAPGGPYSPEFGDDTD